MRDAITKDTDEIVRRRPEYAGEVTTETASLFAAVPSGVPPVDAMIANNASKGSPNSTVMMVATQNIPAPLGGSFETLVLAPWPTSLGFTSSTQTTNAGLVATAAPLRWRSRTRSIPA